MIEGYVSSSSTKLKIKNESGLESREQRKGIARRKQKNKIELSDDAPCTNAAHELKPKCPVVPGRKGGQGNNCRSPTALMCGFTRPTNWKIIDVTNSKHQDQT